MKGELIFQDLVFRARKVKSSMILVSFVKGFIITIEINFEN